LLIKAKQQHGKNENKNTGLFINCMDFVVVRTKINKEKIVLFFLLCLGLGFIGLGVTRSTFLGYSSDRFSKIHQ
jgi:hypothetical protein